MAHTAHCPSGLVVDVRKLRVKEANILADEAGVRRGDTHDEILKSVWVATHDFGPYQATTSGQINWSKVLISDRFYVLTQVRIATYGAVYEVETQCPLSLCRAKFSMDVDLSTLKFKEIPAASLEAFQANKPFETIIPSDGRRVTFRLQTGEMDAKVVKLAKTRRTERLTISLATRIESIEGVHPNDKLKVLEDLAMDDTLALIEAMDEVDGGLETSIQAECPACGHEHELQLPFGRAFWVPSRKKKPEQNTED